ncbi:MAG: SHOCT domain-containing protein [Janthinobacterium lividum]
MNPSDAHSSLAALRQLKELLDTGAITPAEFETLKRQLIFGSEPLLPPTAAAPTPPLAAEVSAAIPTPPLAAETSTAAPVSYPDWGQTTSAAPTPPPEKTPDWLAAPAPGLSFDEEAAAPLEERRNPLNLVFIVGGVLLLLGIVLYLFLDRPSSPDEHLTSATQTAADSVATVPEVGPQAEQLALPPAAAPETIRVAPALRPAVVPATRPLAADSGTVTVAPAAKAPVPAAPAAKTPAPTVPVAPPAKTPAAAKPAPVDTARTKAP